MTTKKKSSYQRLKDKYEAELSLLRKDILTLVQEPESMEANLIKIKYKFYKQQHEQFMAGNTFLNKLTNIGLGRATGLLSHYEKPKNTPE